MTLLSFGKLSWLKQQHCWYQWPRVLRCGGFAAAYLLSLRVRIPPGAWMSGFCDRCVFSSIARCVGLIIRPEESYRVWCVWVWTWSLDNEKALARWGSVMPWGEKYKRLKPNSVLHIYVPRKARPRSARGLQWSAMRVRDVEFVQIAVTLRAFVCKAPVLCEPRQIYCMS